MNTNRFRKNFAAAALIIVVSSCALFAEQSYLYVSLDSLQSIALFKIDSSNGDLILVNKTAVDGQPGSLAVDPLRKFLYAAVRSKNSVASYSINPKDGSLTLLSTVSVSWNPVYVSTDRAGKFLFTAHFGDQRAAVYAIGPNGAVQSGALQVMTTAVNPHSIRIDPSNRFVYVPCRSGESVLQYRFDAAAGTVTANSPAQWTTRDSTGPRHIAFHPSLGVAYVANEFGRSVTVFKMDGVKGTLAEVQNISMQPKNGAVKFIAGNTGGADLHCTPDGRFLYASNRGPDSIAAYAIDRSTGMLSHIAQYPTEQMPRSFAIDPSGKFLYAGGQRSGKISVYLIDRETGELTFVKNYAVGSYPVWLLAVHANISASSGIGEYRRSVPGRLSLSENFPNPFNPETTIEFSVPGDGVTTLKIFNILGEEVAALFHGAAKAGFVKQVKYNGSQLSSGMYLSRLEFNGYSIVKRMALVK